ncbi:uncharacterized protein LOC114393155 isoform X1 [Glycine soja]|uniref:uncharacterized protein LOC114393155 isoform X1 n=1 Tax=Glycine soja TaxID=3848 RepID=UPI00103C6478|nr:uncharacterized protein LOC114393155 isoform X1 [Glycine soja]
MYVDHAFSISDEDIMMDGPYTVSNKAPIKEISLAVSLLVFGTLAIIIGSLMAYNHVGGDNAHEDPLMRINYAHFGELRKLIGVHMTRIVGGRFLNFSLFTLLCSLYLPHYNK